MHGWKDVLKVEYNDPHKFASKLGGFPFTLRTNTVGHLYMADRVSRRGKRKTVQFRGMFVWIIVFYFYNIFLPICIL